MVSDDIEMHSDDDFEKTLELLDEDIAQVKLCFNLCTNTLS